MRLINIASLLAFSASFFCAQAIPVDNQAKVEAGLRFIKERENLPGKWMTEDEVYFEVFA
jgi:hypothetical protein